MANGTKLWSNLPGSVQSADIPEITVFLQRKLATDDEWPDLYVRQDATGAWVPAGNADGSVGAVAWTSRMEQASDDSNRYTYSIASPGDNTNGSSGETLPAFDEDGNLYQYRAREVMVGLLDTPGYLQTDDVANVNFAQDTYVDGTGQVYDIRHGQTGSFYINNVYDATKGSLTVKKLFGGRDVGDAYPDVEFVLYRQYEGEGGLSSPERVAAGTITAEELKQAEADGSDATYTFEGLEAIRSQRSVLALLRGGGLHRRLRHAGGSGRFGSGGGRVWRRRSRRRRRGLAARREGRRHVDGGCGNVRRRWRARVRHGR